jgi:hypothetical protein
MHKSVQHVYLMRTSNRELCQMKPDLAIAEYSTCRKIEDWHWEQVVFGRFHRISLARIINACSTIEIIMFPNQIHRITNLSTYAVRTSKQIVRKLKLSDRSIFQLFSPFSGTISSPSSCAYFSADPCWMRGETARDHEDRFWSRVLDPDWLSLVGLQGNSCSENVLG